MNTSLTNRQNQILDTSIEIIHSEGIQGFTMKNLSSAIGVTDAAIYRHFKSKNEILCAVLDNFINKLTNFIEKIKLTDDGALEKIKKIYQKLSNTFTNKPAYVSVIFAEEIFKNSKTLSEKVGKILDINNKAFKAIIEEGQAKNEITNDVDSQDLALMIMGSFRLLVKNWKMCCFSFNLIEKTKKLYTSMEIIININRKKV